MAVYTKLTDDEIKSHLKNYNIGELVEFKEIIAGIDNSNFIVKTSQDKYILTIFEKRIKEQEIPYFIDLKLHLAKNNICCPRPILNDNNKAISTIKNKNSVIVSFLSGQTLKPRNDGYYDNITIKHCSEVGSILAKLHQAAKGYEKFRKNDLSYDGFRDLFNKFSDLIDDYQKGLKDEIEQAIKFVEDNWQNDLLSGPCHLDLFADNVFFDEESNLSGVIDFYFAANDLLIYDFAIIVNAWCFDENNNFITEKFNKMKDSYQKIRKFNDQESKFLSIALFAAALRFLLTRLHDKFFTPKDSIVNIKDPQEYIMKLRYFKKWQ